MVMLRSCPQRLLRSCFVLLVGLLVVLRRTATAIDDPYINGTWSPVGAWPIAPIHMILLKTGKVLSYGTTPAGDNGQGFYYDVWEPSLGLFDPSSHRTLPTQTATNIFCSGQVNIPGVDGEVLIMGGSQYYNGVKNSGTYHTQIFHSTNETLSMSGNNSMHLARWYPSVTVLASGNIVAQVRVFFFSSRRLWHRPTNRKRRATTLSQVSPFSRLHNVIFGNRVE
jgi:hypothetical protein